MAESSETIKTVNRTVKGFTSNDVVAIGGEGTSMIDAFRSEEHTSELQSR